MNRERCKELLPVFQAFAEGKAIEYQIIDDDDPTWWPLEDGLMDCIDEIEYRIKPEKRVIWLWPSLQDVWIDVCVPDDDDIEEHGLIKFVEAE